MIEPREGSSAKQGRRKPVRVTERLGQEGLDRVSGAAKRMLKRLAQDPPVQEESEKPTGGN